MKIIIKKTKLSRELRQLSTKSEQIMWNMLRQRQINNLKFRRQHPIGPFVVDFYCSEINLVIEVDGDIHAFPKNRLKDELRERYIKSQGLRIIRITNGDVFGNIDGVGEFLFKETEKLLTPHPNPLPQGEREERKK